jgi:hypothetical protein
MATQNEHGRLIAAAAKAALGPIGCFRRGQSRVWLSDEGYWAIMVEFQPSGFSKGSYLNVGASWLWSTTWKSGLAFDVGDRVAGVGFVPFENAEQFRPLITEMAKRSAQEVQAIRQKFSSIDAISLYLGGRSGSTHWDFFHAAVASGLNGDTDSARSYLQQLDATASSFDWQRELHSEAAQLAAVLEDHERFVEIVRQKIRQRRLKGSLLSIDDPFATMAPSLNRSRKAL